VTCPELFGGWEGGLPRSSERARHACSVKPQVLVEKFSQPAQRATAVHKMRSFFAISDETPCARFAGLLVRLLLYLGLAP